MNNVDDTNNIDELNNAGTMSDDLPVQIYAGRYKYKDSNKSKVIVFDLDETLGSFSDLMILHEGLSHYGITMNQENFNQLLDLFPEFLRPGIIPILEYVSSKKLKKKCEKIYLYTNNKYSPDFPNKISHYFSYKIYPGLFDQVICAFKVGNKIIEPMRTSSKKSYSDFIQCSVLPKSTEICFIDDVYHKQMVHDKIYYIQPAPFIHRLSSQIMIDRASSLVSNNNFARSYFKLTFFYKKLFGSSKEQDEMAFKITQKIMYHLKEFFILSTTRPSMTRKKNAKFVRATRKKLAL